MNSLSNERCQYFFLISSYFNLIVFWIYSFQERFNSLQGSFRILIFCKVLLVLPFIVDPIFYRLTGDSIYISVFPKFFPRCLSRRRRWYLFLVSPCYCIIILLYWFIYLLRLCVFLYLVVNISENSLFMFLISLLTLFLTCTEWSFFQYPNNFNSCSFDVFA